MQEVEGKEEDRKGQVEVEEEKRLKEVRSWMTMEMFMTRGGGRNKRRQERTGGSRRGEATQGGALMDDYGDVYDKTQILSQ